MKATRRDVLTGAAALAAAGAPAVARAAALADDPILPLIAERARLQKLAFALDGSLCELRLSLPEDVQHPDPRPRPGIPHYETLLRLRDKFGGISRDAVREHMGREVLYAFNRADLDMDQVAAEAAKRRAEGEAMLAWWDGERARIDQAREDSGYTSMDDDYDEASDGWIELESEIADAPATSLAGIIAKLAIAAEAIVDDYCGDLDKMPGHERCVVGALADLKRLAARVTE